MPGEGAGAAGRAAGAAGAGLGRGGRGGRGLPDLGRAGRGVVVLRRLPGAGRDPDHGGGRRGAARAPGWRWSARRRGRTRTAPAGRSSAGPGRLLDGCWPRPGWTASGGRGGQRAAVPAAGQPHPDRDRRRPAAAAGWTASCTLVGPELVVTLGLTAAAWFLGRGVRLGAVRGDGARGGRPPGAADLPPVRGDPLRPGRRAAGRRCAPTSRWPPRCLRRPASDASGAE